MDFFSSLRMQLWPIKQKLFGSQTQLRHLHSQFDMLTRQASALIQGERARVPAASTVRRHLTTIDDSLSARVLQMNAVLRRMVSTAQELARYRSGDVCQPVLLSLRSEL
ncbi:HAUS augmin-like complex subunit 3 [Pyrus ussuriensis x Pyrus communis]|uniref:HAUS augmin-like complex subunit 3 n=1 Tax=Pyrus ussuriensis x Pyrus communis TaxID=2448454 RepID=A0A5N5IA20_9ROSA|nr:HAUS augmin-like complex subunit 3 [Pyrus ussuriensis x Pyrus communis]